MTNQTSFQRKFLCLPLAFALIASACDDGSSAGEPNTNVVVVPSEASNNSTNVDTPSTVTTTDTPSTVTTTDNPDNVTTTDNPDNVTTADNPDNVTTTDNPDNVTTENNSENTNAQQYEDAFVQLSYPEDWILNTSVDGLSAQFLDSELNATGGQDNCGLFSEFIPDSSLIEFTSQILGLYDDIPEPQASFPIVNGFEMSRIAGTITLFGLTINVTTQIAYENQNAHVIQCFDVDPENMDLILNSMVIR